MNPGKDKSAPSRSEAAARRRKELGTSLLALGILSLCSAALSLYLSRESFFTNDEIGFFVLDGAYGMRTYIDPFIGHLVVLPRLVYGLVFRLFGPDYLPIRLLTALSIVGLSWAVFSYAVQRVRPYAALAPAVILLFFGADPLHFIYGNAIVVLPAVALGAGAMAALYRPSPRRDILACLLLVAAILCYSQALPFLLGAGVAVALQPHWRRRAWVVGVPLAIYAIWWLWSLGFETSSTAQTNPDLLTFLSLPSVMFALLGFTLDGISGIFFRSPWIAPDPGPALAVLAIGVVCWAGSKRGWRQLLPSVVALVGMLALVGLVMASVQPETVTEISFSRVSRYLFPLAAVSLLVTSDLLAAIRIDGRRLGWMAAVVAISVAGSIVAIAQPSNSSTGMPAIPLRGIPPVVLAGTNDQVRGETNALVTSLLIWSTEANARKKTTGTRPLNGNAYADAIDRFGQPQANYNWMGGWEPGRRAWLDEKIVTYLGIEPEPAPRGLQVVGECRTTLAPSKGLLKTPLPRGGAIVRVRNGSGQLRLSRIGEGPGAAIGSARVRGRLLLLIPPDGAPEDKFWTLRVDADAVEVCRLPRRIPLDREGGQ